MKLLTKTLLVAGCLSFATNDASAHAVAIGYTPGVSAGQVNLWLGSYHQNGVGDGNDLEGSARLQGVSLVFDTTTPFTYSTPFSATPFVPSGLVSGTNLTFLSGYGPGSMYSWEAVTMSGLSAGTYSFSYVAQAFPTAHWSLLGLGSINLTLTAGDVGGGGTNVPSGSSVPDGGSTMALLGLAMTAVAGARRKFGV